MPPATVIRMPAASGRLRHDAVQSGGIQICCCRVFTCINLGFITSKEGLLKLGEVILGSMCQTLLVRFGLPAAEDIGQAFNSFLTTASSCLMTSFLLMICYMISTKSFNLIRQSLFVSIYLYVIWFADKYLVFIPDLLLYRRCCSTRLHVFYIWVHRLIWDSLLTSIFIHVFNWNRRTWPIRQWLQFM